MSLELTQDERDELASLDVKELAFQIWALQADRKPSKTVDILRKEFGHEVDPRIISVWKGRYDWLGKQRALLHDVGPDWIERAASGIVGGLPDAVNFLTAASRREPWTLNEKGDVDRGAVAASVALLDRGGFMPHTRKTGGELAASRISPGGDGDVWDGLTDDALRAIVAGRVAYLPDTNE